MIEPLHLSASREAGRGTLLRLTPEDAGWTYVGFELVRLDPGEHIVRGGDNRETCVVVLVGVCTISTDNAKWDHLGRRMSVFDGPPAAVYIPPAQQFAIHTAGGVEVAVCTAPGGGGVASYSLSPEAILPIRRGSNSTGRVVRNILMEDRPAESLLVTEVVTPGGHWSSYPPHKHDEDNDPHEAYLEETYFFQLARPEGIGVQRVYTPNRECDRLIAVGHGDVVTVPQGYHPVAALPGYDLYYLNVMAGPRREWQVSFDPDYAWQAADFRNQGGGGRRSRLNKS